jgi:A/G-specific adenine glycosylase
VLYDGALPWIDEVRRIRRRLLDWYARERRDLPWRRTADPYRIWLSEIMLQQTRVAAAIPYYERFLARFPGLATLAAAREEDVLAAWSGLGYYSRARSLHKAARLVATAGRFPQDLEGLRALPGVGAYTAAAIASIAFGLPHAAVDGNAVRTLARLTGEKGDVGAARVRRRLEDAAARLLDRRRPGEFNQALMELGATLCMPRRPQCVPCPVAAFCTARAGGFARELPVKARSTKARQVSETLLLIKRGNTVLLRQRPPGSPRMAGFWELPEASLLPAAQPLETLGEIRHTITNSNYRLRIVAATLGRPPHGFRFFSPEDLARIPLGAATRKALARYDR